MLLTYNPADVLTDYITVFQQSSHQTLGLKTSVVHQLVYRHTILLIDLFCWENHINY